MVNELKLILGLAFFQQLSVIFNGSVFLRETERSCVVYQSMNGCRLTRHTLNHLIEIFGLYEAN